MRPNATRYFTYIRPIIRSKFARTYSSLIFTLLTVAIFSFYAIRPTVTTILSLQKSIDEQNQILTKLHDKVNNLASGKHNYESIDTDTKSKLEYLIPDNPALPALIDSLSAAVNASHASISGIQVQTLILENKKTQLSKDAALNPIDFTLNTEGSFSDLMNLLTTLKRSTRLITISSVNFSQPEDSALTMTISGKAYYLKN